jgi:hypothetical protein
MTSLTDMRDPAAEILEFSRKRRFMMWLWVVVTSAIVVGILVFANLITAKHKKRLDLTRDQMFSIDDATRAALKNVAVDVDIYVTYLQDANPYQVDLSLPQAYILLKNVLTEFHHANERIRVEFAENEGDEVVSKIRGHFGGQSSANVVYIVAHRGDPPLRLAVPIMELYQGDAKTGSLRVFFGESRLASAIIQATSDRRHLVYSTVGHNEMTAARSDSGSTALLTRALDGWANTNVKELDLPAAEKIPDDCEVLFMPGVRADLEPREIAMLQAYLEDGGRIFAGLEIDTAPRFCKFLETWGIRANNDRVVDISEARTRDIAQIRVRQFGDHPTSQGMENIGFILTAPRSIDPIDSGNPRRRSTGTLYAGPNAWAQPASRRKIQQEPGDPTAPCLAAASSTLVDNPKAKRKEAKLLVWGSYVAFTDYTLAQGSDVREDYVGYLLNNFRWLMDQEGAITVPPKRLARRPVEISAVQANVMLGVSVVAMPLVGVVLGIIAWFFRRK